MRNNLNNSHLQAFVNDPKTIIQPKRKIIQMQFKKQIK